MWTVLFADECGSTTSAFQTGLALVLGGIAITPEAYPARIASS
jgi:hypothetical protein